MKEINQIKPVMDCKKCKTKIFPNMTHCPVCKTPIEKPISLGTSTTSQTQTQDPQTNTSKISQKVYVRMSEFDSKYGLPEKMMLEEFITEISKKAEFDLKTKDMPEQAYKRKKVYHILFSVLLFIYISMIFFHFPLLTYIMGLIILIILFFMTRRYNLMKYLIKEIESRPSEKILNIIMNVKESLVPNDFRKVNIVSTLIAIVLPLVIFSSPRIIYEKADGGYAVRYYTFGLTNFKTAEIPEMHKNEKIVALRGNTFSNMKFLETVKLPDTIKEIRGQAFYNNINLLNVNIPKELEYLGGGNFTNCTKITSIILPDSLTEIGGESFMNASNLKEVKLPKNLKEIRGNTFENCTSLTSIEIPDSVTRIGAHAFRGNTNLTNVYISKNSKLEEIGSSAFRECYRLNEVTIPINVYVNERAFKGNGTQIFRYGDSNGTESIIQNFESDYLDFLTNGTINVLYLNNYQNKIDVFNGYLNNKTKILLTGKMTNPKGYEGFFDFIVKYYNDNKEEIGGCEKKVKLYDNYLGEVPVRCETNNYDMTQDFQNIKYYKIYMENFNITN